MKTLSAVFALLAIGAVSSRADPITAASQNALPAPSAYAITQQDGNSQVWEQTTYEPDQNGNPVAKKHHYTELATGLNHLVNGQWVASSEEITLLSNGTAAATNGQHQAYFPANIYDGQIELVTPDGLQLKSQPVGLCYDDGNNTVFIAVLTNSIGQLLNTNQVIYTNAFAGVDADLVYTYTKAGFEQDIVLRAQPPTPGSLNLDPNNTRLQVLTEFFDPPQPTTVTNTLPDQAGISLDDESLGFGAMEMVPGKAFILGENSPTVQVAKSWVTLQGRQFLAEQVPVAAMANQLENLPSAQASAATQSQAMLQKFVLPPQHLARKTTLPMTLAKIGLNQKPGVVLDYVTVNSSQTNFTFQGDTTYYISGTTYSYGTNTFEGGTVLKYATGATLDLTTGPPGASTPYINWKGSAYSPVVFTAKDDNTIGALISGSSGSPSGYYGTMLAITALSPAPTLVSLRMSYASFGISCSAASLNLINSQFVSCNQGFNLSGSVVWLENALFANTKTNFVFGGGGTVNAQNVTFNGATNIAQGGSSNAGNFLTLTNCILSNDANLTNGFVTVSGNYNGFYNSQEYGGNPVTNNSSPFQTVGGGSYYLPTNSVFHNAGTTNINPALLAELSTKTTYPPMVYSNVTLTGPITFSPQTSRDTNSSPDLGYHYDPVDYFFGGVHVTTNITFTAGTVMGWFELPGNGGPGYGISLPNYVSATFNGTVTSPCVEARYETVQEGGNGLWKDKGWLAGIIGAGSSLSMSAASIINAEFTDFALFNNDPNDVRDYNAGLIFQPEHCEFWSGGFGGYIISMNLTNCLFECAQIAQDSGESGNVVSVENCTFHRASISLTTSTAFPVSVLNCALDGTAVTATGYAANASYAAYDYNAFTNTSNPFPLGGSHDVVVTNSFNWQSSWFGNYYQLPTSPLIDMGSTTANLLGLYHFTTQTNQTIEGDSLVDIGYHYVATGTNGIPLDSNGDGIPDYLEDANGNGIDDTNEIPWNLPVGNLILWLRADKGVTNSAGAISGWADQSGNNNPATQTVMANQPVWVTNAINGFPAVQFYAVTNQYLGLRDFMSGTAGAEALVVLKVAVDPPTASRGLWDFGSGGLAGFYPDTSGAVEDNFASTSVHSLGVPVQPLTQFHVYNVAGTNGYWSAWINGVLQAQTTSNTYGEGWDSLGGTPYGGNPFDGDIAEVLVFNRMLTGNERTAANAYLNGKYGLVPAVPATPTNLVAQAVATNQISLTWQETFNQGATSVSLERSTSSSGPYVPIVELSDAMSYLDTNLATGTTYYYRARAINLSTWSAYSNITNATTFASGVSLPLGNLILWLKADTGVAEIGTNTAVNFWADQSANYNNATQSTPVNQPLWMANGLNGLPVVQFNGTNSYLNLPNLFNGTTGAEALVVLKVTQDPPLSTSTLWTFGGSVSANQYPDSYGRIQDDFGSTSVSDIGVPAQPLTQYHVYNVAGANGYWAAWINGVLQAQTTNNTYSYASPGVLGSRGGSYPFAGDIAEVLVFNRTLTKDERAAANVYLDGKYGLVPAVPSTPTNLVAQAVATNQISLTWSEPYTNGGTTEVVVERSTTSNGTFMVVAELNDAMSYVDTNLVAGTTYYYELQAANLGQWSAPSSEAWATTLASGASVPLGNLILWLKADTGLAEIGTNTPVNLWADQSGNNNHAAQTGSSGQPVWTANGLNGLPVVQFNATSNQYFNLPNFMNGTTGAEALVVLKVAIDPPAAPRGLWDLGSGGYAGFYPDTSRAVEDNFASISVHSLGVPAQPLTQYHVYNVAGANGYWAAWINGILQAYSGNNTYGEGWDSLGGTAYGGNPFDGDIAEVLVFNRTLTEDERTAANLYLNGKYGLVSAVPSAPTNLVAQAVATNQISLTWQETFNQGATLVSLERKTGSGGTYAPVAELSEATSYVDTNLAAGTTYYYQARAINLNTWSSYSNPTNATTLTNGASVPLGNLIVWLKADMGLTEIGTNTPVNFWADQSGNNNNAAQTGTSGQPLWVANGLNGLPVVQFNGTNSYLNLLNFLNGTTGAEALVVLKTATNPPANNETIWWWGLDSGSFYPNPSGQIQESFGSIQSYNLGVPAQPLTQYHLYDVAGANGYWAARINGLLQLEEPGNTYGYNTSSSYGLGYNPAYSGYYFGGDVAEIMVFNRTLTAGEQDSVGNYLMSKYSLYQYATNAALPSAPTNLVAFGLAPSKLNLQWTYPSNNASSFHLERELGTNGGYTEISSSGVQSFLTNFVDTTALSSNQYNYRVRAHNYFGDTYSAVISPPTIALTNWPANILQNSANLIQAKSTDLNGTISSVQFVANNGIYATDTTAPYSASWIPTSAGPCLLSALVTDSLGNSQYATGVTLISYLNSSGDGIPGSQQVLQGNNPINPWMPPAINTNDITAPVITLLIPTNAVIVH